jgi:hypothetical protein
LKPSRSPPLCTQLTVLPRAGGVRNRSLEVFCGVR